MLGEKGSNSAIWTEKYRPSSFDEFKGQNHIIDKIKSFLDKKNMPHLLFSGPAGVGKTTLALIVAKYLYKEKWSESFLELNASDERGIDVIRNNVKDFAKTKSLDDVPFKIIYLDECDALTREAQQALRRTMENYTKTTRFILSCNYSSKIIDPIQSRCAIFRFRRLSQNEIFELVDELAKDENIKITEDGRKALSISANGDCRRLKNLMQSCATISNEITDKTVYSLSSIARPEEIKEIIQLTLKGNFKDARRKLLDTTLNYGLSGLDIVKQIEENILDMEIPDKYKMKFIEKCAQAEFRMVEGSDEYIQLEALLAYGTQLGLSLK